jgi:hypothetical protein
MATKTFSTTSKPVTNANLTGVITSVGNATSIASQTGTGTKFVVDTSPTIVTPVITTSISTPSIIGTGAVGITPASGSNLNVTLATTGDLAVNTNQLYVDTSLGNVGIGTTAPVTKLDIYGASTVLDSAGNVQIRSSDAQAADKGGELTFGGNYTNAGDRGNFAAITGRKENGATTDMAGYLVFATTLGSNSTLTERMRITSTGNVGIGTTAPNYKLEIGSDSAGKPGLGGLWTVVSDKRLKQDIVLADLDRCYEIVKTIPLKHFGWTEGVYTEEQVKDRHGLGWIAQDVQKTFPKAVNTVPFTKKIDTGEVEEYELVDNKPQFVTVTKTRPIIKEEIIKDCLDLNSGQIIAALYGCVQKLQTVVEDLTTRLEKLEK